MPVQIIPSITRQRGESMSRRFRSGSITITLTGARSRSPTNWTRNFASFIPGITPRYSLLLSWIRSGTSGPATRTCTLIMRISSIPSSETRLLREYAHGCVHYLRCYGCPPYRCLLQGDPVDFGKINATGFTDGTGTASSPWRTGAVCLYSIPHRRTPSCGTRPQATCSTACGWTRV